MIGVQWGNEITRSRFAGERVERVFIYPGATEHRNDWVAGVNRLAGLFHVGMIYEETRPWWNGRVVPFLYMSAMRVWSPHPNGSNTNRSHKQRQTIGSGVVRHSRGIDLAKLFPKGVDSRLRRLV